MKLSDFNLFIDNNNIIIKGPKGFSDEISNNEQYLINYNLAFLLMSIKNKISKKDWKELLEQINNIK